MTYINNKNKTAFCLNNQQENFIEELKKIIEARMPSDLYDHSISTLNYAGKLANIYLNKSTSFGKPERLFYKLCISCILHDYGKIFLPQDLIKTAEREKIKLSKFELACEPLLHGFLAPYLIKRDFGIKDRGILNAIKYHTIGSCKMDIIDKILYISDKIEETRSYENIDYLRSLSGKNINLCLLEVYKSNIMYLITKNKFLHPDTSKIWNNILGGIKNGVR
ncbi:MAG: bis(5'-nucleosyl)-tetraphosphatase (symmetrical) YqeK [Actinobacteria bacterium]|nr:bis(5'-nucleosyl)-tetraphosphatase (symmetrical) YqeK [Actinomycetota bacterium]